MYRIQAWIDFWLWAQPCRKLAVLSGESNKTVVTCAHYCTSSEWQSKSHICYEEFDGAFDEEYGKHVQVAVPEREKTKEEK